MWPLWALVMAGTVGLMAFYPLAKDTSIYEIRSYHIKPDQLENYKTWIGTHGLPHIRERIDVVGFWVNGGIDAEISGADMDELGPANVTWIIKWPSKEVRDEKLPELFNSSEWQEIFARFPGGTQAYQRIEVRFFDAL